MIRLRVSASAKERMMNPRPSSRGRKYAAPGARLEEVTEVQTQQVAGVHISETSLGG